MLVCCQFGPGSRIPIRSEMDLRRLLSIAVKCLADLLLINLKNFILRRVSVSFIIMGGFSLCASVNVHVRIRRRRANCIQTLSNNAGPVGRINVLVGRSRDVVLRVILRIHIEVVVAHLRPIRNWMRTALTEGVLLIGINQE